MEEQYDTSLLDDIYPDTGTTGLKLAADCDWDGIKILEIAAVALTDANYHAEAAQVRQILEGCLQ